MPYFQVMAAKANAALTARGLAAIDAEVFAPGTSLPEGLQSLGIVGSDRERTYLDAFPSGMLEAVRALLYDNARSQKPLDVTFAWAPGYDDELTIWQVADAEHSAGGITVLVKSRYQDDRTTTGQAITAS